MDRVTCMRSSNTVADGKLGCLAISNGGGGNGSVLVTIGSGWTLLLRRGGVEQVSQVIEHYRDFDTDFTLAESLGTSIFGARML